MLVAAALTDINAALVVWTTVTFALLIVVLGKFAWGPILQMIETREKTIAEATEMVRKNQQEVAAAKAELMEHARKESEELLKQARTTIEEERRAAVAD